MRWQTVYCDGVANRRSVIQVHWKNARCWWMFIAKAKYGDRLITAHTVGCWWTVRDSPMQIPLMVIATSPTNWSTVGTNEYRVMCHTQRNDPMASIRTTWKWSQPWNMFVYSSRVSPSNRLANPTGTPWKMKTICVIVAVGHASPWGYPTWS